VVISYGYGQTHVGGSSNAIMLVLFLAVCGNTATLMLARATTRQREPRLRHAARPGLPS
jgi:hypothetical protein